MDQAGPDQTVCSLAEMYGFKEVYQGQVYVEWTTLLLDKVHGLVGDPGLRQSLVRPAQTLTLSGVLRCWLGGLDPTSSTDCLAVYLKRSCY